MKHILLLLLLLTASAKAVTNRYVLVPPFENLTSKRAPMIYYITQPGSSSRGATTNQIDRYSHVPREFLENLLTGIPGIKPVERQRLDTFYAENGFAQVSFVDGERAKKVMQQLAAPIAVQGTILKIAASKSQYSGYVDLNSVRWTASVRVRIYHLGNGRLEIPYSRILTGSSMNMDTPNLKTVMEEDDLALELLASALEELRDDQDFIGALLGGNPSLGEEEITEVPIPFDVIPKGSSIFVDGHFEGKTPDRLFLTTGKPVAIRIEHTGYETWETSIVPRKRLKVVHELLPITPQNSAKKGQ